MALTIEDAEARHPDLIKGQTWVGNHSKYRYWCEMHGEYLQEFNSHGRGKHKRGCPTCGRTKCDKARRKQFEGEVYTFPCGHKVRFPKFGKSTKQVSWNGWTWNCMKCSKKSKKRYQEGRGPSSGLLGRMKYLLRGAIQQSIKWNYKPPNITAEQLVSAWVNQNEFCAWTGEKIELLGRSSALEHNHETGEFRGFVKADANHAEGYLGQLTFEGRVRVFTILYSKEVEEAFKRLGEAKNKDLTKENETATVIT